VVYQVYPRSFQDGNGDGVGDLAGAERRLDHLVDLGVDAVWLSPIFPSPMADFGYDVCDYCDVDPRFGTLADFDRFLAAAHARGLKVLLDFVPNHTSEQHPWFLESRRSRTSPRRDWYIWRDPAPGGGPPNNWLADFGGSAWEWDAGAGQYYLHAYLKEQPDLNWRNPAVREAMLQVLRFWFERGVDGFRIDVLWRLIKAEGFPDDPPNPDYRPGMAGMDRLLQLNSTDQPETIEIAADMRRVAETYPGERLLVGEIYLPIDRLVAYYGPPERPAVHLPFNFQLIEAAWRADELHRIIGDYEAALPPGAWPNWVLGNHDRPRIAQRVGPAQARVAAVLLLTLRGTPTVYYGDELGLPDTAIPPERVQDPRELNEPGFGLGRDPVRSPMPWDSGPQAGFTTGEPWLPLNTDWPSRNVEAQRGDPGSMLNLYRRLLTLRRARPCLALGDLVLQAVQGTVLVYERRLASEGLVVALNLGPDPAGVALPDGAGQAILSTHADLPAVRDGRASLRGDEAAVFEAPASD
jgi:alpha-glucosidase